RSAHCRACEETRMFVLRVALDPHVRRSWQVAALRELSLGGSARPDGAILSAPRVCLRRVLPRSAEGIREWRGDLHRIRVLLVILRLVAGAREALHRADDRTVWPNGAEPGN